VLAQRMNEDIITAALNGRHGVRPSYSSVGIEWLILRP